MANTQDQNGLVARISQEKNVWRAVALIIAFTWVVLFLDTRIQLPSFNWWGAAADLAKEAGAGIVVLLLGFLVAHWFLRHEQEILSRSEVDRIGERVADRVSKIVGSPSLDGTLLDPRNNAHILGLAQHEVCISRETGNSMFEECHLQMKQLLNEGRNFKIVLTEPGSRGAEHTLFRRSNSGKSNLASRQEVARALLNRIFGAGPSTRRRVELRHTAFALPATLIITDPRPHPGGRSEIMYRQVGHLSTQERERFSLRLDSETSPRCAELLISEFDRIFYAASKTVVIPRDERLEAFGWSELFPNFFPNNGSARRGEGQGKPFVPFADPAMLFLVAFEKEDESALRSPMTETRNKVWFGGAQKRARAVDYAIRDGEKWKIGLDGLMELRAAFDEAIKAGSIVMIVNIGPVALGMEECCVASEISEQDLRAGTPEENREFYLYHRDPATRLMRLSITSALEPLLDDRRSHLYLHFQRPELAKRSAFYSKVEDNERTTMLDSTDVTAVLPAELQGSATAVTHAARPA